MLELMNLLTGECQCSPKFNQNSAWFSVTALRKGDRSENQDNLACINGAGMSLCLREQEPRQGRIDDWPRGRMRLAVLDGMGGHRWGRQVAELSARVLVGLPAVDDPELLYRLLDEAHQGLYEEFARQPPFDNSPGAALTLLEVPRIDPEGCEAWLYHVGDTRLYELGPAGDVLCLTIDHVPATRLAIGGYLDEDDWRLQVFQQNRSTISQAFAHGNTLGEPENPSVQIHSPHLVGLNDNVLPAWLKGLGDRRRIRLRPGHRYLLATDGLWNVAKPDQLVADWPDVISTAGNPSTVLQGLLDLLVIHSSREDLKSDNITAILFSLPQLG